MIEGLLKYAPGEQQYTEPNLLLNYYCTSKISKKKLVVLKKLSKGL